MDYHKLIHTLGSSANTVAILVFGAFAVSGCGSSTDAVVTSCELPSDQVNNYLGKWAVKPVPIAFHAGDWTPSEMSAITAAADTWNQFYGTSQNFQIIDYGSSSSPRMSTNALPADLCANVMLNGTKFNAPIVIYKDATTWPTSYSSQLIAITHTCKPTGGTGLENMFSAEIEVNYVNYFTTNLVPDLQTILLHELGHLAGLDHSCNGGSNPGFTDCTANATYANAVMAPIFTFDQGTGQGEQKRALTANDEGRANCLYDGQLQTN